MLFSISSLSEAWFRFSTQVNFDSFTKMVPPTSSLKHGEFPTNVQIRMIQLLVSEIREEYLAPIPENDRGDLIKAYQKLLHSPEETVRLKAARAWAKWEWAFEFLSVCFLQVTMFFFLNPRMSTSRLYVDPKHIAHAEEDKFALWVGLLLVLDEYLYTMSISAFSRIENHFFINEVRGLLFFQYTALLLLYWPEDWTRLGIHAWWSTARESINRQNVSISASWNNF